MADPGEDDFHVVRVKQAMMAAAIKRILLVDHSKFDKVALHVLDDLVSFEAVLVTDGIGDKHAAGGVDASGPTAQRLMRRFAPTKRNATSHRRHYTGRHSMLYVVRGAALLMTNGLTYNDLGGKPELGNTGFEWLGFNRLLDIPIGVLVMATETLDRL